MTQGIPDYTNIQMNMTGLSTFFKDQEIELSTTDSTKLNTIFKECDVENEKGEKGADGLLTGKERKNFLDRIEQLIPNLYQKIVDFSIIVEYAEDIRKTEEECLKALEGNPDDKQNAKNPPTYGLS